MNCGKCISRKAVTNHINKNVKDHQNIDKHVKTKQNYLVVNRSTNFKYKCYWFGTGLNENQFGWL